MSKSPEEYFQDQHFAPEPYTRGVTFSTAEIAFMRKYMGLDAQETLEKLGIKAEIPDSLEPAPEAASSEAFVPEAEAQEFALPEAAPEFELTPIPAEVVSPPAGAPGGSELSAAAQALAAAASALTAAASALSGTSHAPADPCPEPASFAELAPEVPAASVPEAAPEEVFAEPEPVVESVAEPVIEPVSAPEPVAEPEAAVEPEPVAGPEAVTEEAPSEPESAAPAVVDHSEVETFKETVGQQFMIIRAALAGLKQSGSDTSLSDALFRGITTVQTSANYMGLEEIRVYAERTAGIVDQGRKTGIDFSVMTDLLEQEAGIIEDMVFKAISEMLGAAAPAQPTAPEIPAEPVAEAAPEAAAIAAAELSPPSPAPEVPAEPVAEAASVALSAPEPAQVPVYVEAPPADLHGEMAEEEPLDAILRREPELQMVGFYIGKQEFTVPTMAVQEVIRYEVPAKMPAAPRFVAGVINLRGKMTPLVHLRDMLEIRQARETEDRFIIVCRRKGLQIGLIIERVHTMYRVPQADIEWGIEGLLGISNADFISGLLKLHESLVGIVSVDRIVDHVLEE